QLSERLKKQVLGSQKGFKSFLHHINRNKSFSSHILKLKVSKQQPKVLSKYQVSVIMNACTNIRDLFLIQLLWESSMRIG
ncbi:transposase, partial [Bacillus cereus]